MRRKTFAAVLLAVAVAWPAGAVLADAGYGKYLPTKDWASFCPHWVEPVDTGGNQLAYVKAWCANWVADFDKAAIHAVLTAWPDHQVRLYIVPYSGCNSCIGQKYKIATWFSASNWSEGDGSWAVTRTVNDYGDEPGFNSNSYNWTKALRPPTKHYARTAYTDGDGVPNSGDETLDLANCAEWLRPDGTWANGHFEGLHHLGHWRANSTHIIPAAQGVYAWTTLDTALVNDLRTSSTCQGIRVGLADDVGGWDNWANVWMATKEYPGNEPHIRLMYPGDANQDGIVDGLDYGEWSLNYLQAGGWAGGDFNEDGISDGLDYGEWSLHYLHDPGNYYSSPAPVPEPLCLAVLGLGALALIRRRR